MGFNLKNLNTCIIRALVILIFFNNLSISFAQNNLSIIDITKEEVQKGNLRIPIGVNVSDALILINVFPESLNISISEKSGSITRINKDDEQYRVFLKTPGDYNLTIESQDYGIINLPINQLRPKETRVFYIEKSFTELDLNDDMKSFGLALAGYYNNKYKAARQYIMLKHFDEQGNRKTLSKSEWNNIVNNPELMEEFYCYYDTAYNMFAPELIRLLNKNTDKYYGTNYSNLLPEKYDSVKNKILDMFIERFKYNVDTLYIFRN